MKNKLICQMSIIRVCNRLLYSDTITVRYTIYIVQNSEGACRALKFKGSKHVVGHQSPKVKFPVEVCRAR